MPLIGTAGHVDHGKSTLVQSLTGRDPDRWAEEKRRGLTIDLGFAWANLGAAGEVSFVDVPGHERYLKNMLAGIEAIDVALLVVAADEGWMPQSEEHLAVLDLLGVDRGVVAITKTDAVDTDTVQLVVEEVTARLAGTTMSQAAIIPLSARTGAGIDRLRAELADLASRVTADGDRPRLWIDRAFSAPGAGTVVTGTLTEGPLDTGDTLEVFPGRALARVRGMQSHEAEIDHALPGRRLALNLSGIDRSEVHRGTMLGRPGEWLPSGRFTATLKTARYVDGLTSRGAYHLHFGSGAQPASIKRLEDAVALIEVPVPLPMRSGDRFILRDTGRRQVVAGGRVIDPEPGNPRRAMETASLIDPTSGADQVATALLGVRRMDRLDRLAAHSGGGRPTEGVVVEDRALTTERFEELRAELEAAVKKHHDAHPLRPGAPIASLATSLGLPSPLMDRLIEASDSLRRTGPTVASVEHAAGLDAGEEERWAAARERLSAGLAVPGADDLGLDPELIHLLTRIGDLVRISEGLVYLPEQIAEIQGLIQNMPAPFTVAEFRDRAGLTRKYAVPILEWADREGLTVRRGDERRHR